MTDQTATAAQTPDDGLVAVAGATLTAQVNQANDIVQKIHAATADIGNLIADIRDDENTTDEFLKNFQEWHEKAKAQIQDRIDQASKYVEENLLPKREEVDVDALKAQYRELKASIDGGLKFLAPLGFDAEKAGIPALKTLRGGTVSGGGATGIRRPRVNDILVNGESVAKGVKNAKSGKVEQKANFTFAAAYISGKTDTKVETSDLQAAAFAAAKTDDLSTLNGEPFSFHYNVGEGEKMQTFDVKVYPRSNEKSEASNEKTEESTESE